MSGTAAQLRSRSLNIVSLSDMIEGSYRSWDLYTTGQLVDGLQQKKRKKKKEKKKKKENRFSLNGNGIMSSFLGWQFYRSPLYIIFWFGWVLYHINHYRLFNAKSFLYIYIRYIGFGLVGFYGTSTIVGYLMPNPLYTYILNIYDLVWLGFMAY